VRSGEQVLVVKENSRLLTAAEFQSLADVPPEVEWFANIENENTRRAYRHDAHDFMAFAGIHRAEEFRLVKRAHLIAWRKQLEERALEPSTIRRKPCLGHGMGFGLLGISKPLCH
jgi:integrase/recombinase XerD